MNSLPRQIAVVGLVTVAAMSWARSGAAYGTFNCLPDTGECCDTGVEVWKIANPLSMYRDGTSIPTAHQANTAYLKAINGWNNVPLARDKVQHTGVLFNVVRMFDGTSTVTREMMGPWGQTYVDGVKEGGLCKIVEADIALNGQINWQVPDESRAEPPMWPPPADSSRRGWTTMIHEFGHAHGLAHVTTEFSIMTNVGDFDWIRKPLIGSDWDQFGNPYSIYPMASDVVGVRALYPELFSSVTNLAASSAHHDGTSIVSNYESTDMVACGGTTSARITVVNTGNTSVGLNDRFYLSTSPTHHTLTPSNVVWTRGLFKPIVPAQSVYSAVVWFTLSCPIPLNPGTYYLYHSIDYGQTVTESNEGDNIVRIKTYTI